MRYLFVSNLADVFKLLPILAHDRRQDKSERLRIIDRCKSGTAREQQEIHIGENIGDFKITEPVLHCSKELSRTAQTQILLGKAKTVTRLLDDLQALLRRRAPPRDQNAVGIIGSARS